MKKLVVLFVFILAVNFIYAIRINEVEINPLDGKNGAEWIEIYNDESVEIDLSGWEIYDGLSSEKIQHTFGDGESIGSKEFLIVEFSRAVLNNGGEYVLLKNSDGEVVYKTDKFSDSKASSETWQYCSGNWVFRDETKNKKNNCDEEIENNEEDNSQKPSQENPGEEKTEDKEPIVVKINFEEEKPKEDYQEKEVETIKLGAKNINSVEDVESSRSVWIIALLGFLILIALLVFVKSKRYNKNEFN